MAKRSGDLIFVRGANAKSFDLPFGYSHKDAGVRKDIHDVIGIELQVMVASKLEPSSKKQSAYRRCFLTCSGERSGCLDVTAAILSRLLFKSAQ